MKIPISFTYFRYRPRRSGGLSGESIYVRWEILTDWAIPEKDLKGLDLPAWFDVNAHEVLREKFLQFMNSEEVARVFEQYYPSANDKRLMGWKFAKEGR